MNQSRKQSDSATQINLTEESLHGHNKTTQLTSGSITNKTNMLTRKNPKKKEWGGKKVPNEEHLLTPSRVTTAVRMKTKGNKKARIRMVWNRVL